MINTIVFKDIEFLVKDGILGLKKFGKFLNCDEKKALNNGLIEVQIAGNIKPTHCGNKMIFSSEGETLKYLSHRQTENELVIVLRNDNIEVRLFFTAFDDSNAVKIETVIKNISHDTLYIEEVSTIVIKGIGSALDSDKINFYKFTQSHHGECQPRKVNLFNFGFFNANPISQKRLFGANIGSWSTKEELPQGIIEFQGKNLMFQIESNNSWYYEISDNAEGFYLYLGGPNNTYGGWCKRLEPNGIYRTVPVALTSGECITEVIGEMTKYRRHIAGKSTSDEGLPVIFNEYMHLSWDSPCEEKTIGYAKTAADLGAKYYVIDCGWHNEEPGDKIYPYVGQWKESKVRFPHGVRAVTDFIRSLGMKAGLWIEPEIVGCECKEMLEYYNDDCFIQRHGRRIGVMGRYFLDFRNETVWKYMTETMRRMVEDYGADYIKMDYNEDMGVGTDYMSDSSGEGLEQCAAAYLRWVDFMRSKYSSVLFETCSSGGLRMDYETLKHFSLVSTSDQTDYRKYPYIVSNVLSAVIPEQAAVWSYPVDSYGNGKWNFKSTDEWVEENISPEQVIMNMINSFLGRMHLASHIELLSDEKKCLLKKEFHFIIILRP